MPKQPPLDGRYNPFQRQEQLLCGGVHLSVSMPGNILNRKIWFAGDKFQNAVVLLPSMSETMLANLIFAPSSIFCSRFRLRARSSIWFLRKRVSSRNSRCSRSGIKLGLRSPWLSSLAIHPAYYGVSFATGYSLHVLCVDHHRKKPFKLEDVVQRFPKAARTLHCCHLAAILFWPRSHFA